MAGYSGQGLKMEEKDGFYTLKGYSLLENRQITASMEDYLEMMYRLHEREELIRIGTLSRLLHVKPSSAVKMASNLRQQGLLENPMHGQYCLTEKGKEMGRYLVLRHETIHELLCYINQSQEELEQVEKIEHFINRETVHNIRRFLNEADTDKNRAGN